MATATTTERKTTVQDVAEALVPVLDQLSRVDVKRMAAELSSAVKTAGDLTTAFEGLAFELEQTRNWQQEQAAKGQTVEGVDVGALAVAREALRDRLMSCTPRTIEGMEDVITTLMGHVPLGKLREIVEQLEFEDEHRRPPQEQEGHDGSC